MSDAGKYRFEVLEPENCEGCGLCCEGIGSPVAIYTYRTSRSGPYLYRPKDLPEELAREIDLYFAGLWNGDVPQDACLWFDPVTRKCKHHEFRPWVCRQYEVASPACQLERRPYYVGSPLDDDPAAEE